MDSQVFDLVDPVADNGLTVGLFQLVEPQMVIHATAFVVFVDVGLNVGGGDQHDKGQGHGGDGKPAGLFHDAKPSTGKEYCF